MEQQLKASEYGRIAIQQVMFKRLSKRMLADGGARDVMERVQAGGIAAALDPGEGERETSLRVLDEDDGGVGIYLSGIIGIDVIGDDIVEALGDGQAKGKEARVYIDSPGGDAFKGNSIAVKLSRYVPGYTAIVDGLAGSAATIPALQGGKLLFSKGSKWLVHEAAFESLCFSGRAADMDKLAASLRAVNSDMAELYAERTGTDKQAMLDLMAEDRIMGAKEAVKIGFGAMVDKGDEKEDKPFMASGGLLDNSQERLYKSFANHFLKRAKAPGV